MIVPVRHQACIPYTQPELSPNASLLSLLCGMHCPFHFPRASETAFAPCPHHTVALYRYWHSLAISHKPLFSLPLPISESLPKGRICSTWTVAQPAIPVPVTCVSSRCTCFVMRRRFSSFFLIHQVQPLARQLDTTLTTSLWSSLYRYEFNIVF